LQTVTLTLARFDGLAGIAFALGQMALARRDLARVPGAEFWKLCGSGTDGSGGGQGFTPRPNWNVWAILAAFPDRAAAAAALATGQPWRRWRARAAESCTLTLEPVASRGRWAGRAPFRPAPAQDGGPERTPAARGAPLAVLTRASVRPARALRFWSRVPRIQAVVNAHPALAFGVGLGEIPLVHQITFSVWPEASAMAAFARGDGPHAEAVRAVRDGDWFSEELYARFRVTGASGTWGGRDPLHRLKDTA
jgi:spheroidene monooxygenase